MFVKKKPIPTSWENPQDFLSQFKLPSGPQMHFFPCQVTSSTPSISSIRVTLVLPPTMLRFLSHHFQLPSSTEPTARTFGNLFTILSSIALWTLIWLNGVFSKLTMQSPVPLTDILTISGFITFAHSVRKIESCTLSGMHFLVKLFSGALCPVLTHLHISIWIKGVCKAEPRPTPKRSPFTSDQLTRCSTLTVHTD